MKYTKALIVLLVVLFPTLVFAENTVSSTVVTDKAPPTANAPSIVCDTTVMSVQISIIVSAAQTGFVGIASGMTVTDDKL